MNDEVAEQIAPQLVPDVPEIEEFIELAAELDPPCFRFLTDHNVPASVGNLLIAMGHDVVRLGEIMPANTTDPVLARAAIADNRILISWDRDFNAQRLAAPRFAALSRIMMSGPEPQGAARLEAVFDAVDFALRRADGNPIIIRIGTALIQMHF